MMFDSRKVLYTLRVVNQDYGRAATKDGQLTEKYKHVGVARRI